MTRKQDDTAFTKRRGGRPTVRTPENREIILQAIRDGLTEADAYRTAGISERGYFAWKTADEQFVQDIKAALIEFKRRHIRHIDTDPSWQSSAWLLERKFPEEFAKREHLDVTSKDQPLTEIRIVRTSGDRAVPDAA